MVSCYISLDNLFNNNNPLDILAMAYKNKKQQKRHVRELHRTTPVYTGRKAPETKADEVTMSVEKQLSRTQRFIKRIFS